MKKTIFLGLALVSLTAFLAVQHKKLTPPKNWFTKSGKSILC
ncbi:hypothetical protein J582_3435 [Acinetobacter sp. 1566109]|nr:hypothetical protein J582_3435 [Acinetobacter sp. 1566109]